MKRWWLLVVASVGCAQSVDDGGGFRRDGGSNADDASDLADGGDESRDSSRSEDSAATDEDTSASDSSISIDSGANDSGAIDSGTPDTSPSDSGPVDTGPSGPITGGPCVSGVTGATALRVRFYNGGGRPTVAYDTWGLPSKTRQRVTVNGYTIPYTVPAWADAYLGEGGLQLDSSNYIDIELSTVGLSSIARTTLSIYGRSYATGASGSFNWQTFKGTGATPSNFVSNAPPYRWYGGDATASFIAGDGGARLRIKAGPSSGSLVVNKIELCMEAS